VSDLSNIRLFATHPHTCSYLPDEQATTIFVDPSADVDSRLYSRLSEMGFRRSGGHLYRPQCESCQACIPARIPAALFKPDRRQRRCWNRNQDLDICETDNIGTEEHYQLYQRYITQRHQDGDMYPPTREQFDAFLTNEWGVTRFIEFRLQGKLIAVAVTDKMDNGYSAVYTYFEPDESKRSLGVFAVLHQIEQTKKEGLDSVYLGYWIKRCQKMSYKTDYRPLEILVQNRWIRLN
jgi:leucyl-tRNA---protein transferase